MKYEATVDGIIVQVEVSDTGEVFVDGAKQSLDFRSIDGLALYSLLVGNTSYEMLIDEESGHYHVLVQGEPFAVRVREILDVGVKRSNPMPPLKGKVDLKAPIPGVVVRILVQEGDAAQAGQVLAVLESMKMENELCAPGNGIVQEVLVSVEDEVNQNQALIVFEVS